MIKRIKRVFAWMKNNPLALGVLGSLIATILIDVWKVVGVSLSKALYEFIITISPLDALELLFFSLFIVLLALLIRQRWNILKLKLEEKMKQYDGLVELTKLPPKEKTILIIPDTFLTVDRGEVSSFPTLHFMLGVHNCSYYRFEPTRVELKSYNSGKKVGEDVWDKTADVGYKSAKGYIRLGEQLPKWGGSWIDFVVPIEKRYDVWHSWDLKGYVTYTDGGKNWKVQIETKHHLFEERSAELERLLEKALGDGGNEKQ